MKGNISNIAKRLFFEVVTPSPSMGFAKNLKKIKIKGDINRGIGEINKLIQKIK